MTDLDDLIARLRAFGPTSPASPAEVLAACREAAAALEALRDEVARKDAALRPFCFFSEGEPSGDLEDAVQYAWEIRYQDRFKDWIDFADITAARAALTDQ